MNLYIIVNNILLNNYDHRGLSKGGKQNISAEGFDKNSNPEDLKNKIKELEQNRDDLSKNKNDCDRLKIKKQFQKRIEELRGLLKVIKRGGSMSPFFIPIPVVILEIMIGPITTPPQVY